MQQAGWLRSEWGTTEKNREARFYAITTQGRKQLAQEKQSWARLTEGSLIPAARASRTDPMRVLRDA